MQLEIFLRICIELDLDMPLVPHIYIRGYKLNLEYEGLHSICFQCGRFGQKKDHCVELVGVEMRLSQGE